MRLGYVLQERGQYPPTVVRSPFQNGLAPFATGVPLYAVIDAIFCKGQCGNTDRRREAENYRSYEGATSRYTNVRGGNILVQPEEPYGSLDGARLGGDLGWVLVQEVGTRTAFIHQQNRTVKVECSEQMATAVGIDNWDHLLNKGWWGQDHSVYWQIPYDDDGAYELVAGVLDRLWSQ